MTDRLPARPDGRSMATLCVRGAYQPEPVTGAINTPIFLSTTFVQDGPGEHRGYHYGRAGNPTRTALEASLAALEGAEYGFAFASGCAAATSALLLLHSGDHIIAGEDLYGGTHRLLAGVLADFDIAASFVDMGDLDAVRRALRPTTRMLWAETPSNPHLRITDLAALAEIARDSDCILAVDNTFATPILQTPLALGATLVLHSTTKYLNGHCDVLGGALLTNDAALADRLRLLQRAVGAVPSPFDCYLVLRGLKTLQVRMARQVESARALAGWLAGQPGVERVYYPGLPDHPGHELAARQMRGPGAIIALDLHGDAPAARAFLRATQLFSCAISLGGVESLAEHPATMTHAIIPASARQRAGIGDGLVRLSVGLEGVEELRGDLAQALVAARRACSDGSGESPPAGIASASSASGAS